MEIKILFLEIEHPLRMIDDLVILSIFGVSYAALRINISHQKICLLFLGFEAT
jgi:hypothetical protein